MTAPTTSTTPSTTLPPTSLRRGAPARTPVITAAATALAAGLLLAPAGAASAHVRVSADSTSAGGYAQLTFRVPTESDTAATTALRVVLPTGTPFTSVRTRPVPGWTAQVERGALPEPVDVAGATITEAPLAVTWTADPGAEVGPGEYQEFAISVGPLPEAGTDVLLPAEQTYSDGEVVDWAEPTPAGGEEPELPAPVLTTTDATEGAVADDAVPAAATTTSGSDPSARWLGAGGLVLGAAALVVALVRGRRPAAARG